MSRDTYNVKHTYTGTGLLSTYSFDFKITDLLHLEVVEVDSFGDELSRIRGNDASLDVTFDPINGGGSVTLDAPLAAGNFLILLLADDQPLQEFEFRNKQSFTLRQFENALDWISGQIQRLAYRAKQAFRIHDLDEESGFNTQLPYGITQPSNANRVFQTNSTADGLTFGPTTTEIANAQQYATEAKDSAESADESEEIALAAANEAQFLLFDGNMTITFADSPALITNGPYKNKIVTVDASDGDVTINLDSLDSFDDFWKIQFVRKDETPNHIYIVPNTGNGETIDYENVYELNKGLTVIMSEDPNVENMNWVKKFLGITNGGSMLPTGVDEGAYLEFNGVDPVWESGEFAGFSATYNRTFDSLGLRQVLLDILDFSYLAPQVSFGATGSGTIREKGTAVTSSTLAANVTKRTDPIARIRFFKDGVLIDDQNPPSNLGSGTTNYSWTGSFSDNTTFSTTVTDDGTSGGPSNVSASATFSFVYPYYYGCRAPGATGAQVAALTKDVIASSSSLNKSFTAANGDVFYFAQPAGYSDLTSILDINGFETLPSWTKTTKSITGLDASSQSYDVYEFNNVQSANTTSFTFKR